MADVTYTDPSTMVRHGWSRQGENHVKDSRSISFSVEGIINVIGLGNSFKFKFSYEEYSAARLYQRPFN